MKRRDVLKLGVGCIAAAAPSLRPGFAQSTYPERAIKLVIPFAPGGVTDVVGRMWAEKVKASLGTVYVENQGGGGGLIGAATVARATPDGYTVLLGTATQVVVPAATGTALYNPATDLAPVSILLTSALAIVIHPGLPARTLTEFIDYAKANPGTLTYASVGAGSSSHLAGELFKSLTGTPDIVNVPYKGAGAMLGDVMSGHVAMTVPGVTSHILDLHRSGKVRMLAVASADRLTAAPDIPTAGESGLSGMIAQNFSGLFAPAGTPRSIIDQIARATRSAMADNEFRQKLIAAGFEPHLDSSPDVARHFVEQETARLTPLIKAIGLKLE